MRLIDRDKLRGDLRSLNNKFMLTKENSCYVHSAKHDIHDTVYRVRTHHPEVKRRLVFVSPEVVWYEATICKCVKLYYDHFCPEINVKLEKYVKYLNL